MAAPSSNVFNFFVIILIIQMFFSFAITTVTHTVPAAAQNYINVFDPGNSFDLEDKAREYDNQIRPAGESQTEVSLESMAGLVFYSGNIIVDLVLNAVFALPELITILTTGILNLLPLDSFLVMQISMLSFVLFAVLYVIGVFKMLLSIRGSVSGVSV